MKAVEEKEAQLRAATIAQARQKVLEDETRREAEAKAARDAKAEVDRRLKEKLEQERLATRRREEEEAKAEAAREALEAKQKTASTRGQVGAEWRRWVERQKGIKKDVIEVVKADRATKTGLSLGMRLITRGLGQVVNTREGVVRVVSGLSSEGAWLNRLDQRHPQDLL